MTCREMKPERSTGDRKGSSMKGSSGEGCDRGGGAGDRDGRGKKEGNREGGNGRSGVSSLLLGLDFLTL